MKFRKLNFGIKGVITAIAITLTIIACNNSDKSAKTSTTGTNTDTSTNTDTLNKMSATTVPKKKGRVTTMVATNKPAGNTTMKKDNMGYYDYTEVAPAFPGGQSALEDYITNHIEYPQQAIDNNIEGTVNVKFTIDENGKTDNAKVAGNDPGYGLGDAAVQVISQMPKWTPGKVKGKNVKAWYTLPVTYKLEE
jgi:TonB family protein